MSEAVSLSTPPDLQRPPLVSNNRSLAWITNNVASICEEGTPIWWWISFLIFSPLALVGLF